MLVTWASITGDILKHQYTPELQHCITQTNAQTIWYRTKVHSLKNYRRKKDRTEMQLHMLHAQNYRYGARGGIPRMNKLGLYNVYLYKRANVQAFGAWE